MSRFPSSASPTHFEDAFSLSDEYAPFGFAEELRTNPTYHVPSTGASREVPAAELLMSWRAVRPPFDGRTANSSNSQPERRLPRTFSDAIQGCSIFGNSCGYKEHVDNSFLSDFRFRNYSQYPTVRSEGMPFHRAGTNHRQTATARADNPTARSLLYGSTLEVPRYPVGNPSILEDSPDLCAALTAGTVLNRNLRQLLQDVRCRDPLGDASVPVNDRSRHCGGEFHDVGLVSDRRDHVEPMLPLHTNRALSVDHCLELTRNSDSFSEWHNSSKPKPPPYFLDATPSTIRPPLAYTPQENANSASEHKPLALSPPGLHRPLDGPPLQPIAFDPSAANPLKRLVAPSKTLEPDKRWTNGTLPTVCNVNLTKPSILSNQDFPTLQSAHSASVRRGTRENA